MASATWCKKCKESQAFGKFCVKCGSELEQHAQCQCGEELWNYMKFCPACGSPAIMEMALADARRQ